MLPDAGKLDPLSILFEDEALLFVNKPPGIVVQRGYDADEPVLLELAQQYANEKHEELFLMQRLDRGTSGVMFFSKLSKINANLTRQFERKQIRKTYVALSEGLVVGQLVDAPLSRIGPISFGVRREGRRALTHIEPIESGANGSLLLIQLLTGRTHQIRVHLAAIGNPLVGDWLYGSRNAVRPMLHAARLDMRHPLSGESVAVSASIPVDFRDEAGSRGMVAMTDRDLSLTRPKLSYDDYNLL
ncbi:MAG TPA: RluA family pseudouridine synthase [Thermoanaerobaculia bacterium]|nr:RluA family pseudouridine synthase [Thermoanaerobaculia bacterium]